MTLYADTTFYDLCLRQCVGVKGGERDREGKIHKNKQAYWKYSPQILALRCLVISSLSMFLFIESKFFSSLIHSYTSSSPNTYYLLTE